MNNFNVAKRSQPMPGLWRGQEGGSLVELALTIPLLLLLLLGAGDFCRVFYTSIGLADAARAGAQYGSQDTIVASDITGMVNAAKQDAADIPGITVTASECVCTPTTGITTCGASYCTYSPKATYVVVDTQVAFKTLFTFTGIPSSLALSRKAVMQVAQ
jgi:Flp pilus assembly protein TadG